jgi:hypothetical protein
MQGWLHVGRFLNWVDPTRERSSVTAAGKHQGGWLQLERGGISWSADIMANAAMLLGETGHDGGREAQTEQSMHRVHKQLDSLRRVHVPYLNPSTRPQRGVVGLLKG